MTPRQDADKEHDDNALLPSTPALPPPSLNLPTSHTPPKLRRPLSSAAPEFYPATPSTPDMPAITPGSAASTPTTASTTFLIRPSLELAAPKRSPTVDSLLSALTPDEPRETKEEDTDELWAKLRCGSLRTEEVAEREKQKQERLAKRQNRCADYPGLAFGSAMFGSDNSMKFNIIKNELQNIMRSQLKRVDGEVKALASRVKTLDSNLEESERLIRSATSALSECVALQIEDSKSRSADSESESSLSAFDQHILYLETQLKEAKVKASLSLQIMEDCDRAQETLLQHHPPAPPAPPTLYHPALLSSTPNNCPNTLNNNFEEAIHNTTNNNATTNDIFENEANNNNNNNSVGTTEVSREVRNENMNCLLIREEDSANGNMPLQLPV